MEHTHASETYQAQPLLPKRIIRIRDKGSSGEGWYEHGFAAEARRFFAEMYGTFVLTFIAAVGPMVMHKIGPTASGLAIGLIQGALIFQLGEVSGAHFNGAISFALALRGVFSWWRVLVYWVAQFLGSIIAASFILLLFEEVNYNAATMPRAGFSDWQAFGFETIYTLILILTVLHVAQKWRLVGSSPALAIAFVGSALSLIGGGTSSASMNPTRSFGPAIFAGGRALKVYWVYFVAPFFGASIATLFSYFMHVSPAVSRRRREEELEIESSVEKEDERLPEVRVDPLHA
jgi:aquaporin Z